MTQTVLITGASSGFGKVIAERFLAEGWNVVATMRRPDSALYPPHDRLRILPLDVTDAASIGAAVAGAIEAFGRVDVLVNNAGIGVMSALEFTPDAIVREIFDTNLFGMIAMSRALIPHMRAQGGGAILNMTSSMAVAPMPFMSIYSSTKWAIEGFSEALAYEVAPLGIRVKLLEPGLAPTTRFGSNSEGRMAGLTPPPYDDIAQAYFGGLQKNYPAAFTTEAEVAAATLAAATDGSAQLRYRIGEDTQWLYDKRRSLSDDAFLDSIRAIFVA